MNKIQALGNQLELITRCSTPQSHDGHLLSSLSLFTRKSMGKPVGKAANHSDKSSSSPAFHHLHALHLPFSIHLQKPHVLLLRLPCACAYGHIPLNPFSMASLQSHTCIYPMPSFPSTHIFPTSHSFSPCLHAPYPHFLFSKSPCTCTYGHTPCPFPSLPVLTRRYFLPLFPSLPQLALY